MMSSASAKSAAASPPDLVHLEIKGRRNNLYSRNPIFFLFDKERIYLNSFEDVSIHLVMF